MERRASDTARRLIQASTLNVPIVAYILLRCYRYVTEVV
jgi:hypothetical protein